MVVFNTCPKPGQKPGPEEIPERNLPGWARMLVLVGINLPGQLQAELKIFYIYVTAWQDRSRLGQDDSISGHCQPDHESSGPVVLGIIFFRAATYTSGPGLGQVLIATD